MPKRKQQELFWEEAISLHPATKRTRQGFEIELTEKEVALLRMPITETSGGYQSAMQQAMARIYWTGRVWVWRVSDSLMRRLFRYCTDQGEHGGYQKRLPMEKLWPIFLRHQDDWTGTYFYGRQEVGDTSRIKFGHSDDVERRTPDYATDNPQKLIRVFQVWDPSGNYESRAERHFAVFADNERRKKRGLPEWFLCVPQIRSFVEQCQRVKSTDELPQFEK